MENIKLKDLEGKEIVYEGVKAINVPKKVSGLASFSDTSDADAVAANIIKGKTAYVNGDKITGTAEVTVQGKKLIVPDGFISVK